MGLITLTDSVDAKIMIRAANWVGDAIMTTPVVRAIRKNYPKAQITVLAKPWVIPVYENNPYIDKIMIYQANDRHKRGWGTITLSKDLRVYQFDLAILMQNAFEAGLISFLGRIKERVGYNTDARGFLLNRSIKLDMALKKKHLVEYYIGILKGAGLEDDGPHMDLFLSQPDREYADALLKQNKIAPLKPVIGINPGATGGTAKRWFPERYAKLCERLAHQYQTRILIFGGPSDAPLGDYIAGLTGDNCLNIAGKTSLGQAFALIEKCDLFVTNDSGLMHAAAALNINQVAVMGSTDYVATCPASKKAVMVRVPVHCSPCLKDVCPTEHECMDQISVDMVMETCQSLLMQDQP